MPDDFTFTFLQGIVIIQAVGDDLGMMEERTMNEIPDLPGRIFVAMDLFGIYRVASHSRSM